MMYICVCMWTATLVPYFVAACITYDLKKLTCISQSSVIDIPSLFLTLFLFFFAVVHHHSYRRMTRYNNNSSNSKSDSPPPSLVPSFNHHRFVSFGPAASPIVDAAVVFSSFSILQSYHYYCCH